MHTLDKNYAFELLTQFMCQIFTLILSFTHIFWGGFLESLPDSAVCFVSEFERWNEIGRLVHEYIVENNALFLAAKLTVILPSQSIEN